jgi:hypothetical protein
MARKLLSVIVVIGGCLYNSVASGQLLFTECATKADLIATHQPPPEYLRNFMTGGGAVGDFDNDGWPDLFMVDGGTAPDRLFMNNGDGTFTDRAGDWGLDEVHWGTAAAVGDYDGNGWLDIYVTSICRTSAGPQEVGAHRLYQNTGEGTFVEVAEAAGVATTATVKPGGFGVAWGDYDLDGHLDLFVAAWDPKTDGNRLFRNRGDGTFEDATVDAGIDPAGMQGFQPRFVDMNGDRYPELLVSADFMTSRYYANDGDGTFTDETVDSGTGLDGNGMGSTIGDFDGDGRLDWYVTSIWTMIKHPTIPGTGNMLYLNQGDHVYVESGQLMEVHDGGWGWGSSGVDLDLDGWIDIVEVNGWNKVGEDDFSIERAKVFLSDEGTGFTEVAGTCGFESVGQGRGLVRLDYDRDGDQDFVVFSAGGPLELYRNDLVSANGWLTIHLDTSRTDRVAPRGVGSLARVTTAEGMQLMRSLASETTYLAQSELSAHFGLGVTAGPATVVIEWANGFVTTLENVPVDQIMTVSYKPGDVDGDGTVTFQDLVELLSVWGACPAPPESCWSDTDGDGVVGIADLLEILSTWEV